MSVYRQKKDSKPGKNETEWKRLLWIFPQDSLLGKNSTTLQNKDTKTTKNKRG